MIFFIIPIIIIFLNTHHLILYRLNNQSCDIDHSFGIKRAKSESQSECFFFCGTNWRILKQYWWILACCFEQKQSVLEFEVGRLTCLVRLYYMFASIHTIYCRTFYIEYKNMQGDICSLLCLSHANKFMRGSANLFPFFYLVHAFFRYRI